MRSDAITYETVCAKINEMLLNGEKINVRNVRARSGGASARIAEFIKRWHDEHTNLDINATNNTISDALQQAIIADRNLLIANITNAHKTEIRELNALLQEVRILLSEQEQTTLSKNEEINSLQVQLIEANQRNVTYQELIVQLEIKLESSLKEQNKAMTDSARALLQLERSDSLNNEMKQQIHNLQEQLMTTNNARHSAEKDSAVWQSKYEQAEILINRLAKK